MRKLIYAVIFVLLFSTVAIAHEFCGKVCDHEYDSVCSLEQEEQFRIQIKGCAAYRALEEFASFELTIGGHKIGRIIEKTKLINEVTNDSGIFIGASSPKKNKPLELEIFISLFEFPKPKLFTCMIVRVTFTKNDYSELKWSVESELSKKVNGRLVTIDHIYGMFEYMVEAYETIDID